LTGITPILARVGGQAAIGGVAHNPQGPITAYDPADPINRKKFNAADRFFAPINTVHAISWEHAAKGNLIPAQTTWDFAA
jgi:hypothetical protein